MSSLLNYAPNISAAYGARHMTPENEQTWGSALGHGVLGPVITAAPAIALGYAGARGMRALGKKHPIQTEMPNIDPKAIDYLRTSEIARLANIPMSYFGGRASKKWFGGDTSSPTADIMDIGKQTKDTEKTSSASLYKTGSKDALIKLGLLGSALLSPITKSLGESAMSTGLSDKALYDNIAQQVAEQGINIKDHPNLPGPAYISGKSGGKLERKIQEMGLNTGGEEFINMPFNIGAAHRADILAHELGHKHLQNKKYLKHIQSPLARAASPLGSIGSFIAGATADEERSPLTDAAIVALPQVPLLAGEGYASYKGDKLLRRAGATPAQLSQSRKALGKAFGTYGVNALGGAALNYGLGRLAQEM